MNKRRVSLLLVSTVATISATAAIPAFDAQFSATSKDCTYGNYSNNSQHAFSETNGHSAVTFTHRSRPQDKKNFDTMWSVETRPFAVTGGYEGFVQVVLAGHVGKSLRPGAVLTWLQADGSPLLYQDALGNQSALKIGIHMPWPRADLGETIAWTRCQVPPGAKFAKMKVEVDGPDIKDGQSVSVRRFAYYEHVRGEPYELDDLEAPEIVILNTSPSADLTEPIRFRITDKSGVDFSATKVSLDGKELALDTLSREGDAYVIRPSAPWEENSIHEVSLESTDTRGNSGTDSGFVAFTRTEVRHPACTVRDDGMMSVGGKAFFPFGWFRMRPCEGNGFDMDRGVREMMENGMNAGHTYMADRDGADVRELLGELQEICQRRRLLLYVEPTERHVSRPRFVPLAEEVMFKYRQFAYPVLWGIGDDTSLSLRPEELRRYHRLCKAVDPLLLTVSADVAGSAGLYEPYVPNVDITAVESYPGGGEQHPESMAKVAMDMDNAWAATRAVGRKDRSVMVLPKCFAGWNFNWSRYPSIAEIKCQAYVAAACRARGILYYASTGQRWHIRGPKPGEKVEYVATCPLDRPELKAEFFAFAREFSALLPSLAKRDAAKQPTVRVLKGPTVNFYGAAPIRCLLKEDGLLVAANTAFDDVTAEITLPSGDCIKHVFPRYGYLVSFRATDVWFQNARSR